MKKHDAPILQAIKARQEYKKRVLAQYTEGDNSYGLPDGFVDLRDPFARAKQLGLFEKSSDTNSLIRDALEVTRETLDQFDFPLLPDVRFARVRNERHAISDSEKMISGEIILNVEFNTLTGTRYQAEIPVPVSEGKVLPPSVIHHDGRTSVIAQSTVDALVQRGTSYEMEPLRGQYDAPHTREERQFAAEYKNEIGYQPRHNPGNMFDFKRGQAEPDEFYEFPTDEEKEEKVNFHRGTPGGWEKVIELLTKAEEDGRDTFPRPYHYVERYYIQEIVPVVSRDRWLPHLINAGWVLNPYGKGPNRGRGIRAQMMDKEIPMEMDGEPESVSPEPKMYPNTKTPMEPDDHVKFMGNDGPIKGKIVEINSDDDYMIVHSKGMEYRVHVEDIEPLPRTFRKMYADKIPGGLGDKKKDSDFPPKALEKGRKVEKEHTDDPDIADEIAKDHLTESSEYYDELEKMEKKLSSRYNPWQKIAEGL